MSKTESFSHTDMEIGPRWNEHYPKRRDDTKSNAILQAIILTVDVRAHAIAEGDWSEKIGHVLVSFGIPRYEFDRVRLEQERERRKMVRHPLRTQT